MPQTLVVLGATSGEAAQSAGNQQAETLRMAAQSVETQWTAAQSAEAHRMAARWVDVPTLAALAASLAIPGSRAEQALEAGAQRALAEARVHHRSALRMQIVQTTPVCESCAASPRINASNA